MRSETDVTLKWIIRNIACQFQRKRQFPKVTENPGMRKYDEMLGKL